MASPDCNVRAKSYPMNVTINSKPKSASPIVKWVGGKRQLQDKLLPILRAGLGDSTGHFYEPFIGGGAMFFSLNHGASTISDINKGLINLYEVLSQDSESFLNLVSETERRYNETEEGNKRAFYYACREEFNREPRSGLGQAVNFLFLNKACFNGMYRENKSGAFNVPFGNKSSINLGDAENFRSAAMVLERAQILNTSFLEATKNAVKGDLVYFDPPYIPLTATSAFTSYSADGFDFRKQEELAAEFERLDRLGVNVVLSNSSSPLVEKLYEQFNLYPVQATRNVSARTSGRSPVTELIVTNF